MTEGRHLVVWSDAAELAGAEQALATLVTNLSSETRVTVASSTIEAINFISAGRPTANRQLVPPLATKSDMRRSAMVRRIIEELRPDVLHLNKTEVADLRYVEFVARSAGQARLISVVHHVEPAATAPARALTRWLAARASATVAVGSAPGRQLESILGLPVGRVETIANALPSFEPESGPEAELDRRLATGPVGSARLTIGVLARFVPHKAIDHVVAATAALDGVRLVIGGDGPERHRIERQVERLGLADRVELLGWVPPERVLNTCDILVSAARIEGHPLALLDARRRGLPIVATDVGAVSDIVEHGVTGYLVPADDVTGLCAAIDELADDPRLRVSMGQAARLAAAAYTPAAMARAYETIYWGDRASSCGDRPWTRPVPALTDREALRR